MRKSLMSLRLATVLAAAFSCQPAAAQEYADYRYILTTTPGIPALSQPQGIAVGRFSGRIFVADTGRHVIRDVIPRRSTAIYAGTLDSAGSLDGPVTQALFNNPIGLAFDETTDTLYVADTGNHTVRKIHAGVVTTLAGLAGAAGSADGTGSAARFNAPRGISVVRDITGLVAILVADTGNHTIRRIAEDGTVTTLAGLAGVPGSADGSGSSARFNRPWGIAGGLVTDSGNHTIRLVQLDGTVTTRSGLAGVAGSANGVGSAARFNTPTGITCCAEGASYVTDTGNHTIRLVGFGGDVYTIGGSPGSPGFNESGPGGARFRSPMAIAMDEGWDIFLADTGNSAIVSGVVGGGGRAPDSLEDPSGQSVPLGGSAIFNCLGGGRPLGTVEWEQSLDGITWERLTDDEPYSGARSRTLTVAAIYAVHQRRFRCVVANAYGTATSGPAGLAILGAMIPGPVKFAATRMAAGSPLVAVTPPQAVNLRWGGATPSWTVTTNQSWLRVTGGSGLGDGVFTLAVDPVNEPASTGTFSAELLVSASDASRSFVLPVTLTVMLTSTSAPAFGVIDTPTDNVTGLDGAIPITGWALDDIAVSRVEIWRDRVAGEPTPVTVGGPGNGKIFIANATFVPGVRPDVERLFSGTPLASNGGWGYMLLTHGLYNQGNGTYRLYAFAYDVDGHVTTLGVRTISVDNAHATRPFGTIDIPSYGGTVSGVVQGFGWALTPGFCTIQNPDVQMSVDSGPLTPVSYGDPRSDVAGLFSGYSNASAAGAHFLLDTTQLSNGLHTISFVVTDTCGRSAGLGSRFFTVDHK